MVRQAHQPRTRIPWVVKPQAVLASSWLLLHPLHKRTRHVLPLRCSVLRCGRRWQHDHMLGTKTSIETHDWLFRHVGTYCIVGMCMRQVYIQPCRHANAVYLKHRCKHAPPCIYSDSSIKSPRHSRNLVSGI